MRKINLIVAIAIAGMFMLGGNAAATTFTLSEMALLGLWEVDENPINDVSTFYFSTNDPGLYGSPMSELVGFVGSLYSSPGNPEHPFAYMELGANSTGENSTLGTSGLTTAQIIGLSLGTGPTNSLVGFDRYSLIFENDNDDIWKTNLYLSTSSGGTEVTYVTDWVEIAPSATVVLNLDFLAEGVQNLDNVTKIGFGIGGDMNYDFNNPDTSGNPSNPDIFHISSSPIPEFGTLLLFGGGLLGLIGLGRKRSQISS